jgi:3-phenylpropionate/trans-cinnamate dioxygenase ferredoxin reductase component
VLSHRYLLVGGGMTADAACRGIRDHDESGSIALVGAEPDPPYARPPLSKGLWQGKEEETIWRGTADLGVELHLGRRIARLDLDERTAVDDQGETYGYERLLLATGGRPRRVDAWGEGVVYYRTVADYRRVRAAVHEGARFVVIGGGFIGSEVAAALSWSGAVVTMVLPENGIGARLFPPDLAEFVNGYYREKGVDVLPGEKVEAVEEGVVRLGSGRTLEADGVVAGLGIVPATELAEAAGLPVEDGIVVDDRGRVDGRDDVFAAGDVARFPARALGTQLRVEHEDNANSHGRAVGANMAGADLPYDHLPFFYSDLFELGYEAVGEVDSRLETVADWADPNRKGVVCYVDGDRRPRGFLLWDVWGKVDEATALIVAGEPIEEGQLRGLLG